MIWQLVTKLVVDYSNSIWLLATESVIDELVFKFLGLVSLNSSSRYVLEMAGQLCEHGEGDC